MDTYMFSIVIPVYNRSNLVRRAVNSFLSQDYQSFEIILVDDGSTDNSGEVCDEFARLNDNVKVIHTVNQGAASARNIGMRNATGEYLLFCDDDDYFTGDALKRLSDAINYFGRVDLFVFGFLVGGSIHYILLDILLEKFLGMNIFIVKSCQQRSVWKSEMVET